MNRLFTAVLLAAISPSIPAVSPAFSDTPQRAALGVYNGPSSARVMRVVRAGRFAVVFTRGGEIELQPNVEPILVERFSFGWQPIEALDAPCRLEQLGIASSVAAKLGKGIPATQTELCTGHIGDIGRASDIDAVRRLAHGPIVSGITVVGNFATSNFSGAGEGQALYKRTKSGWKRLTSGGGVLESTDLRSYGVPRSSWCALGAYDLHCATRR